jgi:hypothetical protein
MTGLIVRTQPAGKLVCRVLAVSAGLFALIQLVDAGIKEHRSRWTAGADLLVLLVFAIAGTVPPLLQARKRGLRGVIDVNQAMSLTLRCSIGDVADVMTHALRCIQAREVASFGRDHPVLIAHTGPAWFPSGEEIRADCHPNPDGTTEVHVSSRPRIRLALIDGGRSLANLEGLAMCLEHLAVEQPTV